MATELQRTFKLADDVMLERGQVFHDQLNGELADFTARFPWLDAAWLTAFQADITAADAFPKDESVILDLKVLTGDVTAAMQQGFAALQTLGAYGKLAWPNDVARQRVFGQDTWRDAYNNTLKLQEALELAHTKADSASYKPDLLAKGYTQVEIDQLNTLATDLQTKNGLQEALKVGRHVTKHDRIALLNVVWEHMKTINTCASVVWAADAERMDQYQLYPSSGGGGDDLPTGVVNISGRVTDSNTTFPLENVEVTLYPTATGPGAEDPTAFTDVDGNYSFQFEDVADSFDATVSAKLLGYLNGTLPLFIEPDNDYPDQDFSLTPEPRKKPRSNEQGFYRSYEDT